MSLAGSGWQQLTLVMAGGALGAGLRFAVGGALLRWLGNGFPWGTLAVNAVGAFAAGALWMWLQSRGDEVIWLRSFLIVGVLGGLTTFSALMLELLLFNEQGRNGTALLYLCASLAIGMAAVWGGARLGRLWFLA